MYSNLTQKLQRKIRKKKKLYAKEQVLQTYESSTKEMD